MSLGAGYAEKEVAGKEPCSLAGFLLRIQLTLGLQPVLFRWQEPERRWQGDTGDVGKTTLRYLSSCHLEAQGRSCVELTGEEEK